MYWQIAAQVQILQQSFYQCVAGTVFSTLATMKDSNSRDTDVYFKADSELIVQSVELMRQCTDPLLLRHTVMSSQT